MGHQRIGDRLLQDRIVVRDHPAANEAPLRVARVQVIDRSVRLFIPQPASAISQFSGSTSSCPMTVPVTADQRSSSRAIPAWIHGPVSARSKASSAKASTRCPRPSRSRAVRSTAPTQSEWTSHDDELVITPTRSTPGIRPHLFYVGTGGSWRAIGIPRRRPLDCIEDARTVA